ncbi:molybdenum cofactor biosynthesis protein MoaE [Ignavibacteria bacterium CHB1]|jgi:Molybdopterin converting factor, large subunit|nr:MAG: molybdenum cofactor biosynthesis protein MoaE [Chlorobiota bacterium]KXK05776.1 MAG: Molybdopterin synthase catalytic subunit [Chlorobi bacterium OLB4]MBV6398392.1 hypothetical protein [Ignavibacteria bacterium]MCC6886016.1 molybdenum cofactor biosynthesis protein MoaE [Ignavibacteriales bacterium]MCE7952734.1 molybdenum cofactor biosynthesis protein MoaE [Chlorobi bacterium CHB7]MDL1886844.1 molybdenum cofactor biosynthesis protein MoaE [Ignavibacteria bacterium CHB1]OQY77875.1 MAG: 
MQGKFKNIFIQGPITHGFIAESIENHCHKKNIGGHSIFLGQVRADEKDEGNVTAIEYTAYEQMALEKAHEIREDIFQKYPLICAHIYHSLGVVKSGQISLFVFTSSEHRKAAFDACEELVERIKAELPVWGKELIEGEKFAWKENISNFNDKYNK